MNIDEYSELYKTLISRSIELLENIQISGIISAKEKLDKNTAEEGFWESNEKAKSILREISFSNG